MRPNKLEELISETRWARTYRNGPNSTYFESKFLTGDAQVSAEEIAEKWDSFSSGEQREFALAFACKGTYSENEQKILDLLMETKNRAVWGTIALALTKHLDRERVLNFLMDRIQDHRGSGANYFRALEILADKRVIPILRETYERALAKIRTGGGAEADCVGFLWLSSALWTFTSDPAYEAEIRKSLAHPSDVVRRTAENLLKPAASR